jgi:hypothetical protein
VEKKTKYDPSKYFLNVNGLDKVGHKALNAASYMMVTSGCAWAQPAHPIHNPMHVELINFKEKKNYVTK